MSWRSHEESLRMTLEETRRIRHYGESCIFEGDDVWKISKKGRINDQQRLLGLDNGYIEGLKKINEENIIIKHGLRVFVRKKVLK